MGGETPQGLELDFVVAYPREAEVGKKYLMTVDLRVRGPVQAWPYEEEEYPLYLMVDSEPAFTNEPVGQGTVVLHRFGGTYGPARFVLTARKPAERARVSISLVNSAGLSLRKQSLPDVRVVPAVAATPPPRRRPTPKSAPPDSIGWLHLSNLMMREDQIAGAERFLDVLLEDLDRLYEQCGPWDLVFCSGDLTLHGRSNEFDEVSKLFEELQGRLVELGATPQFIAVPGNLDFERRGSARKILERLRNEISLDVTSSFARQAFHDHFQNYSRWWKAWSAPHEKSLKRGLLPGDFSMEVERNGIRLGIVGLTDVLEAERTGDTLRAQLAAMCDGDFDQWYRGFDACVVLTHERLRALEEEWAQRQQGEPFLLHLTGRSETGGIPQTEPSAAPTLVLPGRALFPFTRDETPKGYLAGRISFERDKGSVRVWPRLVRLPKHEGILIDADRGFGLLEADEGLEAAVFTRPSASVQEAREDWAIVVGINHYPNLANLAGPENDARAFQDWLLATAKVPPEQVMMLLSSSFPPAESASEAKPGPAEVEALFDRILSMATTNQFQRGKVRVGRRLYLYFSGHGVELAGAEPVFVTSDASPGRLSHVAVREYAEWFRESGSFDEVLLFFDCDRQSVGDVPLRLPPYPQARLKPGAEGKLFSALAPRRASESRGDDGQVRGAFTLKLLAGLTGGASDNEGRVTARLLAQYLSGYSQQSAEDELPEIVFDGGRSEDLVIARVPPPPLIPPETLLLNAIDGETGQYQVPLIGLDIGAALALNLAGPLSPDWLRAEGNPDQWGVVFTVNARPALRKALAPLIALRRESTRSEVQILEYSPGETVWRWLGRHERLPYHLLLVGGPEEISFEFQRELGLVHSVGRLSFFNEEEYARYVSSVVAYERGWRPPPANQVTYWGPVHPGDVATQRINDLLLRPLHWEVLSDAAPDFVDEPGRWPGGMMETHLLLENSASIPALARALGSQDRPPSAVVFAAGHGVTFRSDPLRYRLQGGLLSQDWSPFTPVPKEAILAADNFFNASGPLSPIAFFFASFSAGTFMADPVAQTLFRDRPVLPPVVAAVPRQLLSHPDGGTLAVLGQVDWAWAAAAGREVNAEAYLPYRNCLQRIIAGEPVGHAVHREFGRRWALAARKLNDLRNAGVHQGTLQGNDMLRALLDLLDARSLVVLGDPAVRLKLGMDESEALPEGEA